MKVDLFAFLYIRIKKGKIKEYKFQKDDII